ncbi:MAG TPA: autotransporter-associated beta strand repeat-containing protein [Chthoniobacterales bacterium]|jgi:autotransporter-associated beta strand protein
MKAKRKHKFVVKSLSLLSRESLFANRLQSVSALLAFVLATTTSSFAGSATWEARPATGNWSTPTNWTPATSPNGPNDIATFATSRMRSVAPEGATEVNSIVFNPGASQFTIALLTTTLTISGTGVTNNSGVNQNFAPGPGEIDFTNSATAGGSDVVFTNAGNVQFFNTSTAGNATFTNNGAVKFFDNSTAGDVTLSNNAEVLFQSSSTAGNGTITNTGGGTVIFSNGTPTAGNATFTNTGGAVSGEGGGFIIFNSLNEMTGTAGNATFINNGGAVGGAIPGETLFNPGDAGDATLIANGGLGGGGGGLIVFSSAGGVSTGGTARVEVFGNGNLDISQQNASGLTTGSIEGDGLIFLGANNLAVGANNLSTTFSGLLQDGGISHHTGGSLTKTGTGTLTLSGANTYTGGTTVSAGTLLVSNRSGSGTGTGAVKVNAGTIGGSGVITGPVTIGTGSGAGAILAPAAGTRKQATLTSQGALTFNANATYNYSFKAKSNKTRADQVVAMGVTIKAGATFVTQGTIQGVLHPGLVLIVISNASATPINGTFNNLSDGAILTVNGTNFQANYEGGDGNDLTLTVVP